MVISEKSNKNRTIYYFIPDYDRPSWGIGMLYYHVHLLNRNGFNAKVLHEELPFKLSWLKLNVPVEYLNQRTSFSARNDILIVPEVLAGDKRITDIPARKVVFVQNCFSILRNLDNAYTYRELGYEHALTYLPHLHGILRKHFKTSTTDIPAFVAPYYFQEPDETTDSRRKRQIILFPKPRAMDYDIVIRMLRRKLEKPTNKKLINRIIKGREPWKIVELENKSHTEVAELMKQSLLFVCVNTHESFNASVPEAMAAGCIVVCYEAYGPKDFLEDSKNAFVFPNNYVYPLIDKLFKLVDNIENAKHNLAKLRLNAYKTACKFKVEDTERALTAFFENF